MSITWEYPIYLLPHAGGFVALQDQSAADPLNQMLVVMTEHDAAIDLMQQFELPGNPRPLKNAREFRWLIQGVKAPITEVAFDPAPTDDLVNARWRVSIAELIADHLDVDFSPWNYPVFVAAHESGFASIAGAGGDGEPINALCLFSSEEKGEEYLKTAKEEATLCALRTMEEAITFLKGVGDQIEAVALDPQVTEDGRSAKHCFGVQTLLDKYLVRDETE